jgi:bzd-type benzoyl-CoA reductase N subunit
MEKAMPATVTGKAYQTMSEVAGTLIGPPLQSWKDQEGRVIGYFCSMVPEELLMAGGLLPFRMRAPGSTGTDLADAYFTNLNCTFPRHCFSLALDGEFQFLDGLLCLNSCDHIRRLYDNWRRHVPTDFIEFLTLPRQTGSDQMAWYAEEFRRLRERLEQHFAVKITDDKLKEAIQLGNETRRLQRRLYELRKQDRPPITGAETLVVMVASTAMPKKQYNALLRELLDEIGSREGLPNHRARLMITGGILDDPTWVKAIEEVGGLVVTDVTCFGTRLMWEDVDEQASDPIVALASYYLADRPSCPRLYDAQQRRSQFAIQMCREFKCDGIIGEKMMFCDQWNVEQYLLDCDLKEAGIPFLAVEREYITSGTGQLRTRVQAFIETMGK